MDDRIEPDVPETSPPIAPKAGIKNNMSSQAYIPPNFDPTGTTTASGSGSTTDTRPPTVSGNMSTGGRPALNKNASIFSLDFYAQFFDVDTSDVLYRCLLALNPLSQAPFLEHDDGLGLEQSIGSGQSPFAGSSGLVAGGLADLYGPFWICATLVFALFFASTFAGLLFSHWQGVKYEYQFDLLSGAAGMMYGYTFLVPLGLWLVIRYTNISPNTTLLQLICLYGYSNVAWIPVTILPPIVNAPQLSNIVRWVFIAICYALSGSFIVKNIYSALVPMSSANIEVDKKPAMVIMAAMAVLHTALAFAVKLLFFGIKVKN